MNLDEINAELQYVSTRGSSRLRAPGKWGRMPAGLLGYEEGKREQLFEAGLDRQAFGVEKLREARVEELARMYPQVRIREIAASVVPWNYGIFKALAAVQIAKYKQELRSG